MKVQKTALFFVLFGTLFLLNFFILYKLYVRSNKELYTKKILDEIDKVSPYSQFNFSLAPFSINSYSAEVRFSDNRIASLKSFFRKFNSPLYDYAHLIVRLADQYNFDYRLLPAIAMQESNLCKYIPENSHNCWGWGIYGSLVTKFSSYEEAIETVSRGIHDNYINKGLVTASSIMQKYTPSSNGSWAFGVNTFLMMLE